MRGISCCRFYASAQAHAPLLSGHSSPVPNRSDPSRDDAAEDLGHPGLSKNDSETVLQGSNPLQNDANPVSRHSEAPARGSEGGDHDAAQYFCHHSVVFRHDLI